MKEIKQIDIVSKSQKEKLKMIKNLKNDVFLIDEERSFLILLKEKIVIHEISSRYGGPEFYKMSLSNLIELFEEEVEE